MMEIREVSFAVDEHIWGHRLYDEHVRRTSVTNEGDAGADLLRILDVPALADVMQADGTTPIERRTLLRLGPLQPMQS
jgi:hypothetical protein